MNQQSHTIGKLAKATGVYIETVSHNEVKGIIKRLTSFTGYRQYPADDITKNKFVKRTQELGFTLKEAKYNEVEAKTKDLQKIKSSLKQMIKSCRNEERVANDCPILECFEIGRPSRRSNES